MSNIMNNYYIDIKDTDKYRITDKEYSDINILYSRCFSNVPEKSSFINTSIYVIFYVKRKGNR